jgi:hypothetical protein
MPWIAIGAVCVLYTAWELARAWPREAFEPSLPRFGAVDASSGRPLDVTLDRRTRGRRSSDR